MKLRGVAVFIGSVSLLLSSSGFSIDLASAVDSLKQQGIPAMSNLPIPSGMPTVTAMPVSTATPIPTGLPNLPTLNNKKPELTALPIPSNKPTPQNLFNRPVFNKPMTDGQNSAPSAISQQCKDLMAQAKELDQKTRETCRRQRDQDPSAECVALIEQKKELRTKIRECLKPQASSVPQPTNVPQPTATP